MTLGLILLQLKNTNPHIPRTVPSMIKSQTEMEKKIYEIDHSQLSPPMHILLTTGFLVPDC